MEKFLLHSHIIYMFKVGQEAEYEFSYRFPKFNSSVIYDSLKFIWWTWSDWRATKYAT